MPSLGIFSYKMTTNYSKKHIFLIFYAKKFC